VTNVKGHSPQAAAALRIELSDPEPGQQSLRKLTFSSRILREVVIGLDTCAILLTALITFVAFVGGRVEEPGYYGAAIAFVWLVSITLMNFAGLYRLDPVMRPLAYADKLVIAFATTFLFVLAAAFSIKASEIFSRVWMANFAVGACLGTLGVRVLCGLIIGKLADRGIFARHVIVVGAHEQAGKLLDYLKASQPRFVSVVRSFISPQGAAHGDAIPSWEQICTYVRAHKVDDIILALPWSQDQQIAKCVEKLRELPVNVYLASDLVGFRLPLHPSPDHFGDIPVVEVMGQPFAGWDGVKKRALDYTLALIALPIVLPIMAIIAVAIKLESPGPVFFRQLRYGFANEAFAIWKFRTMWHDSRQPKKTLQAVEGDLRITRVGRFLRRSSLDELPQIFNVINSTMSFVGPRPHAVDHNEEYSRLIGGYFARHRVKPGITGWAQVNGLRGPTLTVESMEARVKHDIFYTENWSLPFDLKILAMTVAVAITGRNAY
jgi:Undecaprenyl-phosphate glucose phosphotransferase